MKPFKAGIGILMLETNASVVPVKIKGSYDIWPAGKLPRIIGGRRFGPSVTFGERLTLQKLIERGKLSPYSTDEQIAACIQNIVEEM
jgi:1-acyl-sn-glycerol-3-phosphate acyltransferase